MIPAVKLSLVLPMFNEEEVIPLTLHRLEEVIDNLGVTVEILLVDDGSFDGSIQAARSASPQNATMRIIRMQGNQGHMRAITAGLLSAKGEYVVTMDADLQDPPELIAEMLAIIQSSHCDVVQAVRSERKAADGLFKRSTAKIFYSFMGLLTPGKAIKNAADFRMMKLSVASELANLPEQNKIYRLLITHLGYKIECVFFDRPARAAGETKYPVRKMIELALDSIFSFSVKPLRIITLTGFALSILMISCSIGVLIVKSIIPTVPGWTSLIFLLLASQGVVLAAIGMVGEYVGRTFEQVQGRVKPRFEEA